jgi:peptide/nickel transport system substrate-binding protein
MIGLILAALALAIALAGPARAQTPQRGGTLVFSAIGEPDTYDCHASATFATLHRLAPHYSLLVRIDAARYPAIEGDAARSWSISPDGLTYTFVLRPDVRFHDGAPLTARDVKASFDRIREPAQGAVSLRRAQFRDVAAIDTPDPQTVVFRLARPNAAMLTILANPWNCLYSAERLVRDANYPARQVLGSGPFRFVEHVAGSHWAGVRHDAYHLPERPYLDGFRAVALAGPAVANALSGGQVMAAFHGVTPGERDRILAARGERMRVEDARSTFMLLIAFNSQRPPFDDARVRRALSLAIDRRAGAAPLSRLVIYSEVGGFQRPGTAFARDDDALAALPGFGRDIAAARAEARRLLAEAGLPAPAFTLLNRPDFSPLGVWLIDQWRQIGATVTHQVVDIPRLIGMRRDGNFEVSFDASTESVDEPTIQLAHFLSLDRSAQNASRMVDRAIDGLFDRQAATLDPAERRTLVHAFEARMLEQAYQAPLFWGRRLVPLAAELRGYVVTPSPQLNQDLGGVWLAVGN